jgi:hypothetical protein
MEAFISRRGCSGGYLSSVACFRKSVSDDGNLLGGMMSLLLITHQPVRSHFKIMHFFSFMLLQYAVRMPSTIKL